MPKCYIPPKMLVQLFRVIVLTKVVVVNGSARMEEGNTARVLSPFLEGMKEAGATVALSMPSA
ncbi:MAG: hypothetical protein QXJ02_04705 [Candidatus Bathyarchaeia archaeon]